MSHLGLQILYAVLNGLPEVALRALLRPLAGHGGAAAQPQPSPLLPGVAAAAFRLRHRRLLPPVRALLHECPDDARTGRDPAPPGRAGRGAPADHRRRPLRLQPRPDERLHRRLRDRRGGGGRRGDRRRRHGRPGPGRKAAGAARGPGRDKRRLRPGRPYRRRADPETDHHRSGRLAPSLLPRSSP